MVMMTREEEGLTVMCDKCPIRRRHFAARLNLIEPAFEGQWRGAATHCMLRHLHYMHCRRQLAKLQSKSMDARTHAHARASHRLTICITHTLSSWPQHGMGSWPHTTQHTAWHIAVTLWVLAVPLAGPTTAHTQHTQFSFLLAVIGWLVAMHQQHQMVQTLTLKRPTALVSHGEPMSFVRHCGVECQSGLLGRPGLYPGESLFNLGLESQLSDGCGCIDVVCVVANHLPHRHPPRWVRGTAQGWRLARPLWLYLLVT